MDDLALRAAEMLAPLCGEHACRIGLILGSGLGEYFDRAENVRTLAYAAIPGFPVPRVDGHAGRFAVGELFGKTVLAMQGRFHYYEGYSARELTLGVRVMKLLGVEELLLTNAAGGVDTSFAPGDLMLISDHINYSGMNPLIGENDDRFGPRFPDASNVYDRALRQKARAAAETAGVPLREGVYMMFSGPSYETPAEIRMARAMGASAVGMSTVPEALAAAHCGMRALGVSLITNMAAGVLDQPLSHAEVRRVAALSQTRFAALTDAVVRDVF